VEFGGVIQGSEVDDARKYWALYSAAVAAIKRAALKGAALKLRLTQPAEGDIRFGVKHDILTVKEIGKDGTL
jgi:predicted RNA-binding protein with PUA domain